MRFVPIELGNAGVLAPGRWRWLRAIGWMLLLALVLTFVGFPGWLHLPVNRELLRLGGAAAAVLVYAALVRWGERRPVSEFAPAACPAELGGGLLIGAGMFAAVFACLRLSGLYTLAAGRWTDWAFDLAGMTAVGVFEELLIRGVIFRLLMRAAGLWPALIASAALFGAGHLGNPNATVLGAVAIAIEAGLMLAGFFLLTGRLWMPIGVHIAWNTMQGPVFGARVSGHPEVGSVWTSAPVAGAPEWLSGGIFGPEASVFAMAIGLTVFVVTWIGARRRKLV
jgi:uncharacterized protein